MKKSKRLPDYIRELRLAIALNDQQTINAMLSDYAVGDYWAIRLCDTCRHRTINMCLHGEGL